MLASARMREMLSGLRTSFDHIIVDTPPVLNVTDAVLLSALADSTLLVIRSGMTGKAALRRVHEVLSHVGARIMGVVLNAADTNEPTTIITAIAIALITMSRPRPPRRSDIRTLRRN